MSKHPAWCAQQHDKGDFHESAETTVSTVRAGSGSPMLAHIVDIGLSSKPQPVIWLGWDGLPAGQLLTAEQAREYGQCLIGMAARAE